MTTHKIHAETYKKKKIIRNTIPKKRKTENNTIPSAYIHIQNSYIQRNIHYTQSYIHRKENTYTTTYKKKTHWLLSLQPPSKQNNTLALQ